MVFASAYPSENFYPEFSRAAGKRVCTIITGGGRSGVTAVPAVATQSEVRLPENQLGWSTYSPPDPILEFLDSFCQ
jgi:hypothetical protein